MAIEQIDLERFWSKVNKNGPIQTHMDTPCWEWAGGTTHGGHGQFKADGKNYIASRFVKLITTGDPGVNHALHKCDNAGCVNPEHIYLGTHAKNMQDKADRGRSTAGTHVNAGIDNGMCILNPQIVREIRAERKKGVSGKALADMYGYSQQTICDIVKYRSWAHV